jgi:hypothetical protein
LAGAPRAWAASADTGKPKRLAVVAFPTEPASAPAAAHLAQHAEAAVHAVGRQELVELARLLDSAGNSARDGQTEAGRNAASAARKFYDDLEPQKAAEQCNKALKAFEGADLSGPAFDEMIAAWSLRVAALIANSENKAALAELGLMLPSGGRAVFDPNLFAPDFIAQIKSKRADLAMKGELAFSVDTKPVSALVYIDGNLRGAAPLEVKDLTPGEHFLTLVAPGHQLVQKRFRGGPGVAENVTLETTLKHGPFQPKVDALKAALSTAARGEKLKALAVELGVDQVLALAVTVQGKEMKVVATRGGADGKERSYLSDTLPVQGEAKPGEAANLFLARVLGTDLKPPKGVPGAASESSGWTMRHTGILLIGLGAGVGGGGAGLGWQAQTAADNFKALRDAPQVNPIWRQREQDGRNWALAADLSYAGAAVLAVVGTVLAIVGGGSDEAAPEPSRRPAIRVEEKKAEPAKAQPAAATEEKKPAADPKKAEEKGAAEDEKKRAAEEKQTKAEDEKLRKAEDKKKAEEDKKAAAEERQKKAEDDKQRRAEEKRKAEEERKADAERRAEEKRKAEEERKADAERRAEEKKKAEEERKADAERRAEEKRKAEDERKAAAEAKKKAADDAMKAAEKSQQDAATREYEEARKTEAERIKKEEEALRKAEDERQAEARRKAEEKRLEDEKRKEADRKIRDFDDMRDDR